ncbi:PREDICTED: uncharacterized protein LOC104587824 [Nelumbo nucifera]|uniref:Uncharacterized protein LOC104587824 n=1 Tax=Nelumbo nucifera TaxID=4432 RepID=A0A1U8PYI6_NELNU|nr:PREDICTED: uncharacterized protein LOC104587824 [Nelumbo nucifera]XP_019051613.1 PREDICTED: uncharacterized protein LOC104587824 [Nelumbo nucifera]
MKESIERERERERERRCYCCCIHCKKGRTKRKGGAVIAAAFKSEILKPKNLLAEQRRERKRRVGYQWIIRFLALGCYAMLLIPSFIQGLICIYLKIAMGKISCGICNRNFPQGTISDIVKDASQGISFVCNDISEYGGDLNRIYFETISWCTYCFLCPPGASNKRSW